MERQRDCRLRDQLQRRINHFSICSVILFVTACGGGGGGGSPAINVTPPITPVTQTDFEQGIFSSSALHKDQCAVPRTGNFPDTQGSTEAENDWLRAWSNELYLWYDEIVDVDPALSTTPDYFDLQQTFATTPSGADKDQFHFTFDTEAWIALSQSGIAAGYGADFALLAASPPRNIVVAFVEPGSPAAVAGVELTRGTRILEIDGVDAINGTTQSDVDVLNAGLFPTMAGESHSFLVEDVNGQNQRTVSITSAEITQDPAPINSIISTANGDVGYLLFNSHIATAEERLVDTIDVFATAGITELVLDLRYNGGGFLDIANELAFMIAGPSAAAGRVFDETQFNDKHTTTNPVTGAALAPDTFHQVTQGFSLAAGDPLPSLNLSRVFVLAGAGTCSASEAIINGLRGIGVEVVMIGGTTCGKPYGFYATDNCGTTYFSIQFRGVNAVGFGDYADGFVPDETPVQEYEVQGCVVADDYNNALGDSSEARLSAALGYISTGLCPTVVTSSALALKSPTLNSDGPAIQPHNKMPGSVR